MTMICHIMMMRSVSLVPKGTVTRMTPVMVSLWMNYLERMSYLREMLMMFWIFHTSNISLPLLPFSHRGSILFWAPDHQHPWTLKGIRNPRGCKATEDVLGAIMSLPPQQYPFLIQLKEANMALVRRVFHPKEPWTLKETNSFLVKKSVIDPRTKRRVREWSEVRQVSEIKMNTQQRAQRVALVWLFTISDTTPSSSCQRMAYW